MGRELTQFKPGWKGGPGRPKGSLSLKSILKQILQDVELNGTLTPDGDTVAKHLMVRMVVLAMQGRSSPLFSELRTMIDGKHPEPEPPQGEIDMEAIARRNAEKKSRKKAKAE